MKNGIMVAGIVAMASGLTMMGEGLEAMSNPSAGKRLMDSSDPRWPGYEGWEKRAQNVNGVEVHYQYNPKTGKIDDFKIK